MTAPALHGGQPICACGGPCEHDGSLTAALREQLRIELDDSVLTHTGRSVGDIASGRVADDLMPLVRAIEMDAEARGDATGYERGRAEAAAKIEGLAKHWDDGTNHGQFVAQDLRALAADLSVPGSQEPQP